nr:reverse transcriptase domain-containing protein [Tanacetum cinerariifolium]
MTITRSGMTSKAIKELINQRAVEALAAYEANHAAEFVVESQSHNRYVDVNGNVGGNGNRNGGGNGDENSRGNGNGNEGGMGMEIPIGMIERFQELTMMCTKMIPEEEDRDEIFIRGLLDNIQRNDNRVQHPYKRQNVGEKSVARAYTACNNKKKGYDGRSPYDNKCKLHHEETCTVKYGKCNKVGNITRDCMNVVAATATQRAPVANEARGKAYVLVGGEVNLDSNVIMDVSYDVKIADGRIAETNTVLKSCKLGLLGLPFNIDLMLIELGSFDIIISMDWSANHHAVIVCDEKIIRTPYGDKVLIVQGDRSGKEKKSKLSLISCTKTQKYIKKGCQIFLAQVTKKGTKDKLKEKQLEDVLLYGSF